MRDFLYSSNLIHRHDVSCRMDSLCDDRGDLRVGIVSDGNREEVSRGDDVYTMREASLPSHVLLEGGSGSSPAVDFTIVDHDDHQSVRQLGDIFSHHLR